VTFDRACAVVALVFALVGLYRGLLRQAFGLAGLAGGILAARVVAAPLGILLGPLVGLSTAVATAATTVALFVVCMIFAHALGNLAHDRLGTITGVADKMGGAVVGLLKGMLFVWAMASLVGLLHEHAPELERRLPLLAKLDLSHSRAVALSRDQSALGSYEEAVLRAKLAR
jgi:uncharacterized membrane protein required for colicin V production